MVIAQMPNKLVYETDEMHFFSRQAGCKGFSFHSLHSVFQAVKVFFFSVFVFISLSSFIYVYLYIYIPFIFEHDAALSISLLILKKLVFIKDFISSILRTSIPSEKFLKKFQKSR